jgi:hypothetical protein
MEGVMTNVLRDRQLHAPERFVVSSVFEDGPPREVASTR